VILRRCAVPVAVALALLPAGSAHALGGCSVGTAGVAFGTYDATLPLPTTATGAISVTCDTPLQTVIIALSAGNSGTFVERSLRSGPQQLGYNLYTAPTYATVFGDGSPGTATLTLVTAGLGQPLVPALVYGRMPAGQNVGTGSYSDTITVTVTF
jgi:spore coat protein U-like protein